MYICENLVVEELLTKNLNFLIVTSFSNTIVKVMFQHYHKTEFSSKSDYLSIFYVPEIQTYVYIQYVNLKRQGEFRHMLLK